MTTDDGRFAEPPDANARFAAYLADVAARVDDPTDGEVCRMILDDDPRDQRALFDLVEELAAHPIPPPASLIAITHAVMGISTFVFLVLRYLT
ncbi:MAG: hypothetical protein JXA67_15835 [Micromonosporaceae bacterium]|nr:hypothetical protein [Micromonosporaceae bacterium]